MSKAQIAKKGIRLLIGKCCPSAKDNVFKVKVTSMKLDEHLLMYFSHSKYYYAINKKGAEVGDTVLIRNLESKLTRLVDHEIVDIVYPMGDITDPVTGKKVVASQYRSDMEEYIKAYGKLDSAFDYDSAPPRGSMKNKRDFTYEDTYRKYNEDGTPQPYGVNPY